MNNVITLQHGRTRTTVAPEYGGRIAQIELFDGRAWLPLLFEDAATAIDERDPLAWGCYVMAPWPNRVAGGRFEFDGRTYALPTDREGHALHGLTFDQPWQVVEQRDDSLRIQLTPAPGAWPWRVTYQQAIAVFDDGFRLQLEVTSTDEARFPAGAGWHPWFRRDVRAGHDVRVLVDADRIYELDAMIPSGRVIPVDDVHDLRAYPALGDRRIDACYWNPRGRLAIRWGDIEMTMQSSGNVDHAVVYTPPHAVCLEPQTCVIDAFNIAARRYDGRGMAVLPPGGTLRAASEWRWSLRRT